MKLIRPHCFFTRKNNIFKPRQGFEADFKKARILQVAFCKLVFLKCSNKLLPEDAILRKNICWHYIASIIPGIISSGKVNIKLTIKWKIAEKYTG